MRKKVTSILVFASVILVLMSCQKKPVASFTVSTNTIEQNKPVVFTNTSTDAESYQWEFGDTTISFATSPYHRYDTTGTYTVRLTVFSYKGKFSDEATTTIKVTPPSN